MNVLRKVLQSTAFNVVASMVLLSWGVYLIEPTQENGLLAFFGGLFWAGGVLWFRGSLELFNRNV